MPQRPVAPPHAQRPQHVPPAAPVRLRSSATRTFSATVRSPNSRRFWNVRETPGRADRYGAARSCPGRGARPAPGRPVEPADHVEQRGLAGAVGPDHAADLARRDASARRRRARVSPRNCLVTPSTRRRTSPAAGRTPRHARRERLERPSRRRRPPPRRPSHPATGSAARPGRWARTPPPARPPRRRRAARWWVVDELLADDRQADRAGHAADQALPAADDHHGEQQEHVAMLNDSGET